MKSRIAAATLVVLALAALAHAQDRRDARLAREVSRELAALTSLTIFDHVEGTVVDGVVSLRGKVTMPYKKSEIERRISKMDGVGELRSQIEVLPASAYDDELRRRIARAIYGDPAFWRYAAMAQPPIRIIVENGRVTLSGLVHSHLDRLRARSLASGFGELSVTSELRTDDELRMN